MHKARLTLRKESLSYADGSPCSGILHDSKNLFCHTLPPVLYSLFRNMVEGDHCVPQFASSKGYNGGFSEAEKKVLSALVKSGAIREESGGYSFSASARLVENKMLPTHCLSMPLRVYHTITRRCNLACPQCLVASYSEFPEDRMSTEQSKELIARCYELGVPEWRFTGGEPTFCEDFFEIAWHAKQLGMALMLNSNGCWDQDITDKVLDVGFNEVIISLEGNEAINDSRRSLGSYKKIVRTLNTLAGFNQACRGQDPDKVIRVTINMTVARDNIDQVPYVIRFAAERGFNTNFVPLRPYGRSLEGLKDQMLSTEEFMGLGRLAQDLREDPVIKASGIKIIHKNMDLFCPDYPDRSGEPWPFSYGDCGALTTGWGIGPDGRANTCSFLMGDPYFVSDKPLLDDDIQGVWLGEKMEHFRSAKKVACHAGCKFYHKQCEGMCRAMVLANGGKIEGGKLIGRDPYCFRHLMTKE
jgi:radical SAM protein with 4Fe4S-binding SPASM domain